MTETEYNELVTQLKLKRFPPLVTDYPLEWEGRQLRASDEDIQYIVVHCSATRSTQTYTEAQLMADHLARGFKNIGYHFYIRKDGTRIHPRLLCEVGAHALGYNRRSIGICYEGGLDADGHPADTRTKAQKEVLLDTITVLKTLYPKAKVVGHYQLDIPIPKACPSFDAAAEYKDV